MLQREQTLQELTVAKWEAREMKMVPRKIQEHNERIQTLVANYNNRDTLLYLRGIAYNLDF